MIQSAASSLGRHADLKGGTTGQRFADNIQRVRHARYVGPLAVIWGPGSVRPVQTDVQYSYPSGATSG